VLIAPFGVLAPNCGNLLSGCPPVTCSGVHTGPGATAFTRMPFGASCFAKPLANTKIAPLVAA